MITVVHASDIHFGEPHLPEVASAFLSSAREAEPDLIVVSGDLTQRAKIHEFEGAAAYLEELAGVGGVPVVVTPGNHDVPLYRVVERLFEPYRNYRRFIDEELDTVTRIPGMTVVALNSAAPRRAIVNGRIRGHQLDFARAAFQAAPDGDMRVVVAHHHLAPAPDYEGDTPMPGAKRILEAIQEMDVEMVLGGHLHRGYIVDSLDVYPGRDREHGVVMIHSGTTTSGRGRARERLKNSFNVIRVAPRWLEVTHHMYHEEPGHFLPLSRHRFPRRPHVALPSTARSGEAPSGDEDVSSPGGEVASGASSGASR